MAHSTWKRRRVELPAPWLDDMRRGNKTGGQASWQNYSWFRRRADTPFRPSAALGAVRREERKLPVLDPDDNGFPWSCSATLPPTATSAGAARRLLRLLCSEWNVCEPTSAQLLLTEVVTNVVVHAKTNMIVRLQANDALLRVEVTDGSSNLPHRRHPTLRSEGGRGLLLLDQLCDRWGYSQAMHKLFECKTVWFQLTCQESAREERANLLEFDL